MDRYARLLDLYGGTLRYDTISTDDELVAARIKHVEDFLATTDIDPGRIEVTKDMAGGRGMAGKEAVVVLNRMDSLGAGERGASPAASTSGTSTGRQR